MPSNLAQLFTLSRRRYESEADYRAMQRVIARISISELAERGLDLSAMSMLELGAGRGGYTEEFAKVSPDLVASDIFRAEVFDEELKEVDFRVVDATEQFPFPDSRFDLVYCASLVEHLPDRTNLYSEIGRVVRPGGVALISFPPFWSLSLVGGHQYKPWHFLGEPIAVAMASRRLGTQIQGYAHDYGRGGLFPLAVSQIERELRDHEFEVIDRWSRLSPVNTMKLPGILADLLTWHACFLVAANNEV